MLPLLVPHDLTTSSDELVGAVVVAEDVGGAAGASGHYRYVKVD